jgi:crossover junction endodeoxyribonuclease RusA
MTDQPTTLTLELPWPPSVNHYYRAIARRKVFRGFVKWIGVNILSKDARKYKVAVEHAVIGVRSMGSVRLAVEIYLYPPNGQSFDISNRVKAVEDALENAGIFDNDNQIDRLIVERCEVHKGGSALVQLEEIS